MTWEELNELGEGGVVILDGEIDSRYFDGDYAFIVQIDEDDVLLEITSGDYAGDQWYACQDFHNIHHSHKYNIKPKEKKGLCAFLEKFS